MYFIATSYLILTGI